MLFTCDECGKEFRRPKNHRRGKYKFCSRKCANRHYSKHHQVGGGKYSSAYIKLQNVVAIKKLFEEVKI